MVIFHSYVKLPEGKHINQWENNEKNKYPSEKSWFVQVSWVDDTPNMIGPSFPGSSHHQPVA